LSSPRGIRTRLACLALTLAALALGLGAPEEAQAASPSSSTRVELLQDGGLETSVHTAHPNRYWASVDSILNTPLCGGGFCGGGNATSQPRTGSGWLWFYGNRNLDGTAHWASISQSVVIPAGRTTTLSYWYRNGLTEAPFDAEVQVLIDGTVVKQHRQSTTADDRYALQKVDITAFADGKSHALSFSYRKPGYGASDMTIDDISISSEATLSITAAPTTTITTSYSDVPFGPTRASTTFRDSSTLEATATGLPPGITLKGFATSPAGQVPGTKLWQHQGRVTATPGRYPVSVDVTDGTNHQIVTYAIVVTPERASVTYGGPTEVTAATGTGPVDVPLSAAVSQEADDLPGDLTISTATFVDATTNQVLCIAQVQAAGTASCTYRAYLSAGQVDRDYRVRVLIGGNFNGRTTTDAPLRVSVS